LAEKLVLLPYLAVAWSDKNITELKFKKKLCNGVLSGTVFILVDLKFRFGGMETKP
jgi:hypothetical protein